MSQTKKTGYEVTIIPRQGCAADKSKYNQKFLANQDVAAKNYFNTLVERYQCYNISKPDDNTHQATGQLYIITLTTILEND